MSPKILLPLFALAVLLSACNSTVITEEDRALPEKAPSAQSAGSLTSTGNHSSQMVIELAE
jgi:hypothetical protein